MIIRKLLFEPELLLYLTSGQFEVISNPVVYGARVVGGGYKDGLLFLEVTSPDFHETDPELLDPPVIRRIGRVVPL